MTTPQGEDKGFQVCRKKMATSAEVLCKYNAPEFFKFTEAVLEMKFDEDPKYAALIALFEPILAGCVHKPICVDSAIKVRCYPAVVAVSCWLIYLQLDWLPEVQLCLLFSPLPDVPAGSCTHC